MTDIEAVRRVVDIEVVMFWYGMVLIIIGVLKEIVSVCVASILKAATTPAAAASIDTLEKCI